MSTVAERIRNQINLPGPFFRRHGIQSAFVFGSAVEGGIRSPKDLDVAVLFAHYSFGRYLGALDELQLLLNRREVDLVVLNRSSPALKMEALIKGVLIYSADARAFADFAVNTCFVFEDYLFFKREYQMFWRKRLREGLLVAEKRLNPERMETYLSQVEQAVLRLQELNERFSSFEEFERDPDTRDLCVHHLRIALESVLDVCRYFLAVKGVALNEYDTTSLIALVSEKGLLDRQFARQIKGMAGMRNAIVHVYWRLDYHAVYEAVTKNLNDFGEFARQVTLYLDRSQPAADR
jgi:uncharacterized protein YutE (UPF0331/DUF86 family)/predicted nucleotidyltransferase